MLHGHGPRSEFQDDGGDVGKDHSNSDNRGRGPEGCAHDAAVDGAGAGAIGTGLGIYRLVSLVEAVSQERGAQREGVPLVGIERPELRDEHACYAKADQHQWKDAARGHRQRTEDAEAGHAPSLGGFVANFLRPRLRKFRQILFHRIFLEQIFPPF
eukprot:TRINITY_DN22635_c0_g1_i1.p4 TRINITY_DN22635_c0_g1~~TRINITY_DN22635_c0_g1_i1.p4  ORF type:complete len:156 (+),score=3.11 TRINITY_DN22635_c0_g1_i1:1235-1702(+)